MALVLVLKSENIDLIHQEIENWRSQHEFKDIVYSGYGRLDFDPADRKYMIPVYYHHLVEGVAPALPWGNCQHVSRGVIAVSLDPLPAPPEPIALDTLKRLCGDDTSRPVRFDGEGGWKGN